MWSINAFDVVKYGRPSPGGARFTEFVDAIIRAQAFASSLSYESIRTNLRTNIPDGGVDTRANAPIAHDPTGWMGVPTIWQYKATEARSVSLGDLEDEIHKSYAKKCISEGYGYRFCICDTLTDKKKQDWEAKLTQHAQAISSDAPEAKVVDADDLAEWINHFPALVLRFFYPTLAGAVLHLRAWKQNAVTYTPTFVPVPAWEHAQERIGEHISPENVPPDVVLSLQGEAGIGKTRMVFEVLAEISGAEGLTIYTTDERYAQQVARQLANYESKHGILVADECSVKARGRLREILRGHRDRVRVVAIDNTGERPASAEPQNWLQRIPNDIVEKILEENFPDVSAERRRAYANLSGGFVKLAADMCVHDGEIEAAGHVGPAIESIREYYRHRLSEEEQEVIEALALVRKVGFKGEVAEELANLCSLVSVDQSTIKNTARKLHDVPGFVAQAGRYFYITPEIIAKVAFDRAWQRWVMDDPRQFLERISSSLLEVFMERVARSASEEVRRQVGEFFHRWAGNLEPRDLASPTKMDRLVTLVDTEPETYLATLRRLVEEASKKELLGVVGGQVGDRWGPRRDLVWLAERMAAFPEYFDDSECVLLQLALAESEPEIANNATAIWQQLYRIVLSGTAVPFLGRLNKLRKRFYSENEQISDLALDAFSGVFELRALRMAGPSVVAGKIPPEEWRPQTQGELKECFDAAVTLLGELSNSKVQRLRSKAYDITIRYMDRLLRSGYLEEVRDIFSSDVVSDEIGVQVITAVEEFLHFSRPDSDPSPLPAEYVAEVNDWLETIKPTDLHGRLVTLVGVDPWHHAGLEKEEQWRAEIKSLATQLCRSRKAFEQELEWLCSANARSASVIGEEIGRLDSDGALLDLIVKASMQYESTALARGYIFGLLESSTNQRGRLNKLLDDIEQEKPKIAYELFMAGGYATNALERALKLIDSGRLPAAYLRGFAFGIRSQPLKEKDFGEILTRLVDAVRSGDRRVRKIAVDFIAYRLKREEEEHGAKRILQNKEVRDSIWAVMEATVDDAGTEPYWWTRILEALTPINPDRVARTAAAALPGEGLHQRRHVTALLQEMASKYPDVVMKRLGEAILDDQGGWRFYIDRHNTLIESFPHEVVIDWIQEHGLEAARRLARHLPTPHVEAGEVVVPPLTEFVLRTFEEDDRVFREFCAGMHSFQMYSGDIASQHEKEAEVAKRFLNHPLRRIREWAAQEVEASLGMAREWRQMDEEFHIE